MVRCGTLILAPVVAFAVSMAIAPDRARAAGQDHQTKPTVAPRHQAQEGSSQAAKQEAPPKADTAQPAGKVVAPKAPPPLPERALAVLREGLAEKSPEKRAKAVHALGLLKDSAQAEKFAKEALKDEKGGVRAAAAAALGSMHAVHAHSDLEVALDDEEPEVVLAAANSLLLLKNKTQAYDIYYGVLTGDMRTDKGLVKENLKMFHDRKKLVQLGVEQGIGFIPFAGFGYDAYKTVAKSDSSPVRAAAAKKLAHDPSAATARALTIATHDKNWMVRAAALEAIAERGDKRLMDKIFLSLDDDKDDVRYTAAACIAHLSELPAKRRNTTTAKVAGEGSN